MRTELLLIAAAILTGCAPKQDPGIPLPPPNSGAAAFSTADLAVARTADTVKAIDTAKNVVAINLTNAETNGFKAICCRVQNGVPEIYYNLEQGSLESTNRDLDVAIEGSGFFRVKIDPNIGDGYAYTWNGNFFRNKDGDLVVGIGDGHRLDPPIMIPNDTTRTVITQNGVVKVLRSGQVILTTVGQINLYQFNLPQSLQHLSATLMQETPAAGPAIETKPNENAAGDLQQGFLEASNVELAREKLRMDFLDHWRAIVLR